DVVEVRRVERSLGVARGGRPDVVTLAVGVVLPRVAGGAPVDPSDRPAPRAGGAGEEPAGPPFSGRGGPPRGQGAACGAGPRARGAGCGAGAATAGRRPAPPGHRRGRARSG